MSPKKKQEIVAKGLEELIKPWISSAFPESSNAAECIKVISSKIDNVDYQFHIRRLVSCVQKDPNDIIVQIRETIPDNDTIEGLEISDNGSYANIFTKIKRPKPCKTCSNNTNLGKQKILTNFSQNLLDLFSTELSRRILKYNLGINSVLSLIIKSGKFYLGFNETLKAFRNGKVKSVIIAKNIPPNQKSTIEYWACIFKARIHHFNGNDWQLGRACGKLFRVQALSITDLRDANIIHLFGESQLLCKYFH